MKTRNCNHCGREYAYKIESSKFCSGACRANHSRGSKAVGNLPIEETSDNTTVTDDTQAEQQQQLPEATPPAKSKASLPKAGSGPKYPTLPADAQYIISHLEKENERWEAKYNTKESEHKKLQDKYDSLKEELVTLKTDQKIEEQTSPKGLEGFMDHPAVQALMPHIGPVIGKLMEKHLVGDGMSPATSSVLLDGIGDVESQAWAKLMVEWYGRLPKESQASFAGLVHELTLVSPTELPDRIAKIINVLTNGTTITKSSRIGGI